MALKLSGPDFDNDSYRDDERKAELTEHLGELRARLIRSCLYMALGMVVMYIFSMPAYNVLAAPVLNAIKKIPGSGIRFNNITEPFFIKLQIATFGGLVLAAPLIVLELWGFIAPALTPREKHGVYIVAPMSVVLFVMGVTCAYLILPMATRWFLSYLKDFPQALLLQDPLQYVILAIKIMLVFGILFELPVILMFLGKVGIINSALMIRYWRQIAVGLFTMAMVVAPSNDPGTMLALAIPLTLLFFASIGLVKLVELKQPAE